MPTLSRSVALLRRTLTASWASLLACPGDDFDTTAGDHRGALALLDTACEDAVELGQSRSALDAIRACIAAARDTDLDVPDEEDIAAPIGHDETRETVVDVRALVVRLRNATHPAANALAGDASTRADLAADVARLERALADRSRELGVTLDENDGLRAQLEAAREEIRARASVVGALAAGHAPDFAALADRLDGCALNALRRLAARLDAQPAHRAAGEGVDLGAWVRRSDVLRLCEREALRLQGRRFFAEAESVRRLGALVGDLRSEDVEGGEQKGGEGGEGHGATIGRLGDAGKARVG